MKTKTLGIILIVLGIIMITYTGLHFTTTKKVVDLGPIDINKEKDHSVKWSPIVGVIFIFGGIVLVARNKKIYS
jgi:drug/metabolite transporter (DMT)-like permease